MDYPHKNRSKEKLLLISAYLLLQLNSAEGFQNHLFTPWVPRFSLDGFAGNSSFTQLDLMLPLVANNNNMFYANAQGKYGNDTAWLAGLGAGFRSIINNSQLLGAYVFADKNVSEEGKSFWYISPGIESLGNVWDFRINGYIPSSPKKKFLRRLFADDLGNTDFITFRGHQQFDHQVDLVQVVGTGIDAEIGRCIPKLTNVRAYVGGYYFQPKQDDDIKGVEARIEYALNSQIDFKVWDSYDNNAGNTIGVGIRLSLGGTRNMYPINCIQSRMTDPVIRNLAGVSTGAGVPIVKHKQDTGEVLVRDNIWFFTGNSVDAEAAVESVSTESLSASANLPRANLGASAINLDPNQGTFEHPFNAMDFTQATLDAINRIAPNANLYFNSGQYHAINGLDPITINAGQSLFGRTLDFKHEAIGSLKPVFDGGFIPAGQNLFEALVLLKNNHSIARGFDISDVSGVILRRVDIGLNQFNNAQNFDVGIALNNAQQIVITGSVINTLRTDISPVSVSVNSSQLEFGDSIINNSFASTDPGNITAFSIFDSQVSITGSGINSILLINGDNVTIRTNNAVDITENSQVNISGSQIFSQTTVTGNNNDSNTVRAISLQTSNLNLFNNRINAIALVEQNNVAINQAQDLFITAGLSATTPIINSLRNTFNSYATINGDNTSNNSYGILQDTQATTNSQSDSFNVFSTVAGINQTNNAIGIVLTENASSNNLSIIGSSIVTRATVGVNDSSVGDNESFGVLVRSSNAIVSLLNIDIDSQAIVTEDNAGTSINSARGFFVDTGTALNYDVSIVDSRISAIATIPLGSTGFNIASAISPLSDSNVEVINTTITELVQP